MRTTLKVLAVFFAMVVGYGAAAYSDRNSIPMTDERLDACKAEGGCALITRKALEAMRSSAEATRFGGTRT